ncbi:glycosyltransferase family 4 protein [Caulobacter segnis]
MKPLNILVLTRALPFHHIGGMEAVAWDLSKELSRAGCGVTIITTRCESLPGDSVIDNVRILTLDCQSGAYSQDWNRLSLDMYRQHFSSWTDVVLSISAAGFSLARSTRTDASRPAMVMQAHGTSWGEIVSKVRTRSPIAWAKTIKNLRGMIWDLTYRDFDAVVGVGGAVLKDLRALPTSWLLGETPAVQISNGVDEIAFAYDADARDRIRADLGLGPDHKVVLSASRLHRQKGVKQGIDGFVHAHALDSSLRFVIAGSGPDEDELKGYVKSLGVDDLVLFVGPVPRVRMRDYLSAADTFLFTTLRVEGLPLNVLEALASGLMPVISSHLDGQGFPAIAVQQNDPKSVGVGIDIAMKNIQFRETKLPKEFTLKHCAHLYLEQFHASLNQV